MNFTPSKVQIGTAAFESYQRDLLTGNGRANLPISPVEEYFFIGIYNVPPFNQDLCQASQNN